MAAFKKHKMYKASKVVVAKTMKEHLALKAKGYGHTKPKAKSQSTRRLTGRAAAAAAARTRRNNLRAATATKSAPRSKSLSIGQRVSNFVKSFTKPKSLSPGFGSVNLGISDRSFVNKWSASTPNITAPKQKSFLGNLTGNLARTFGTQIKTIGNFSPIGGAFSPTGMAYNAVRRGML